MDKITLTTPCEQAKSDLRTAASFITGDEPQSVYLRVGLLMLADYAQADGDGTTFPGLAREVVVAHLRECAQCLGITSREASRYAIPLWDMAYDIRDGVDVTPPDPTAPDYEALAAVRPTDPMGFDCAIGPCCHCDPLTRGKCDA